MIARADQPGLRIDGRAAAPTVVAAWASAELVERAVRVWSRKLRRVVSEDEARGMLEEVGRLVEVLGPVKKGVVR